MTALSSRASSRGLVVLAFVASLGAGCGGGGGKGYPAAVGSTGGAGAPDGGGTGTGGTGTGTGGTVTPGSGGASDTGGTGGAPTPGLPVAIADYGTAIIAAVCASDARCGFVPDVASCVATNRVGAGLLTLQADIAASRVNYDATKAGLCIDAIRDSPCTISAVVARNALPDPCAGIFTGTVAIGGTCYAEGECAGGQACYSLDAACTMACCPGTCVAPTTTGGNCASAPCPTGNYPRLTTSAAGITTCRCTPRAAAEGAVCDSADGCMPPLFCIPDASTSATGTGTCGRTLPATGAACILETGCDDFHDYCNASNVCAKWVGVGLPCTAASATTVDNCVWYALCTGGVCKALGGAGAVCMNFPSGGDDCQGALTCAAPGLTCTAPPAEMSCR